MVLSRVQVLVIVSLAGLAFGAPAVRPAPPGRPDRTEIFQKRPAGHSRGRTRISAQIALLRGDQQVGLMDPPRPTKFAADHTSPIEPMPSASRPCAARIDRSRQSRLPLRC